MDGSITPTGLRFDADAGGPDDVVREGTQRTGDDVVVALEVASLIT